MKSCNGNIGALGLSALCTELDGIGSTNTTQGAAALLSKIETEYESVQEALETKLKNLNLTYRQGNEPHNHSPFPPQQESNVGIKQEYSLTIK